MLCYFFITDATLKRKQTKYSFGQILQLRFFKGRGKCHLCFFCFKETVSNRWCCIIIKRGYFTIPFVKAQGSQLCNALGGVG